MDLLLNSILNNSNERTFYIRLQPTTAKFFNLSFKSPVVKPSATFLLEVLSTFLFSFLFFFIIFLSFQETSTALQVEKFDGIYDIFAHLFKIEENEGQRLPQVEDDAHFCEGFEMFGGQKVCHNSLQIYGPAPTHVNNSPPISRSSSFSSPLCKARRRTSELSVPLNSISIPLRPYNTPALSNKPLVPLFHATIVHK